jgi:hypothetical protein
MSDMMSDDRFDDELRRFLAWRATDTAGAPTPQQVAARISGRTRAGGFFGLSPQLVWIILAGLLMAAIVGAAVAAALLLRDSHAVLPAPTDSPSPTAAVGTLTAMDDPIDNYCGESGNDGLPVQLVVRTFDPTHDETLVLISPDGTVLSGKRSDLTFDGGMQQRRLTQAGLERVTDLVFSAGLPDCQPVAFEAGFEDGWLIARRGTERISVWFGDRGTRLMRRNSATEVAAMARLVGQLKNLDDILDPSNWRDPAWESYLPDEWKLMVLLQPDPPDRCGLDLPPTAAPVPSACLRWASDLKLATGLPLLSFGTLYPAISQDSGYATGYRCGVIARPLADAVPDALALEPGFDGPYTRMWMNEGESMSAWLTAHLPTDRGCERPEGGALGQAGPTPSAAPPSDLAPPIDACAVITGAIPGAGTGRGRIEGWTAGGDGWWASCYAEVSPGDVEVLVRGRVTTAADAASYAVSLFGEGVTSESLAGRTVYWNDCFDADNCTPAAAIVSEPHLIVVAWIGQNREDFRAMLETAVQVGVFP